MIGFLWQFRFQREAVILQSVLDAKRTLLLRQIGVFLPPPAPEVPSFLIINVNMAFKTSYVYLY